jgi:nitroreductase
MTLEEIIRYRRSVRLYKDLPIDADIVKHCLELATHAPNSSNMQLWEFYHVTNPAVLQKLAKACLSQQSATSAKQMVVFVTRQDLYRSRAKTMQAMETQNVVNHSPDDKKEKRIQNWCVFRPK